MWYFPYPFDFIYQLSYNKLIHQDVFFWGLFSFKRHRISSQNYIYLYLLFWKYHWKEYWLISFFYRNLFSCVNLPCLWWLKLNRYGKHILHILYSSFHSNNFVNDLLLTNLKSIICHFADGDTRRGCVQSTGNVAKQLKTEP